MKLVNPFIFLFALAILPWLVATAPVPASSADDKIRKRYDTTRRTNSLSPSLRHTAPEISERNPAPQERTLEEELMDFVALISTEKELEIVLTYVAEDAKVQAALANMLVDNSQNLKKRQVDILDVDQVKARLAELGINVEAIEQFVRDLFGWN